MSAISRRNVLPVMPLLLLLLLLVWVAAPAVAHTSLRSMTPEDGAELPQAPDQVVLEFTDDVVDLGAAVAVTGPSGSVEVAPPTVSGPTVAAGLPDTLGAGEYGVEWRVSAADGHPISGSFSFTVAESASPPLGPSTSPAPDGATPAPEPSATIPVGPVEPLAEEDAASSAWLFAVPAVVVGLLLAGFALVRSRRGR